MTNLSFAETNIPTSPHHVRGRIDELMNNIATPAEPDLQQEDVVILQILE